MFMPFLNDEVSVLFCQFLGSREFPDFHSSGFTEFNGILRIENGFTITLPNMDVNRPVIVAVKRELESVLLENQGHRRNMMDTNESCKIPCSGA